MPRTAHAAEQSPFFASRKKVTSAIRLIPGVLTFRGRINGALPRRLTEERPERLRKTFQDFRYLLKKIASQVIARCSLKYCSD